MNYRLTFCALFLALGVTARADALNERQVDPDAKWLVHIDCDNLRQTQLGGFLYNRLLVPKVAEMSGELKLNLSNALERISSLTAYGTDFNTGPDASGVLLINCDSETQKVLEGLLVAQILADTNGMVQKLANDSHTVYSVADQVFISPQKGGPVVVSKSEERIDAARERLAGRSPTAKLSKNFGEFPAVSNSFFFVGLADAGNLPQFIPARAKVLQMADGGRVALGERQDLVFVNLTLRGKTAEVAQQIQQVVEGMVALVTLGQPEYPDLMNLAKSVKVSSAEQLVTISVDYPASKVIDKITEEMSPKPKPEKLDKQDRPARQKAKVKSKKKRAPAPAPEPEAGVEPQAPSEPAANPPAEPAAQPAPAPAPAASEAKPSN